MEPQDYKNLITEIVRKQIDILGPDIAIRKANNVTGLKIADNGEIASLTGDPLEITEKLVSEYIALSGEIVKNILGPVFSKYPEIKLNSIS